MKLRIKDDTIRLRVQRAEIQALAASGSLYGVLHLGPGESEVLSYGLAVSDEEAVGLEYTPGRITVTVPRPLLDDWVTTDRVGFDAEVDTGDHVVKVLVEKDFQCLVDRPGEDESDAFPNPRAGESC